MTATPAPSQPASPFDAQYYATGCGTPMQRDAAWLAQFAHIADRILSDMQPQSVLDAGCAMGFLVEALRAKGVAAWGIDISEYAISQVHESARAFCSVGSVTAPLARRYDLITCIEVLEHLPQADAEMAIANFCAHTDDVLFSSSPNDFAEPTHYNVQPPEYWAEQFARHGFFRDVDCDLTHITPWAARFRKIHAPAHFLARDYERRFWQLQQENVELRKAIARNDAAQLQHARAENAQLRQLVQAYESGRFMRFMAALKRALGMAK
jgi:SAM-dependent methyltransferase